MPRRYTLTHKILAYILLSSLFLQNCGGKLSNQPITQEKKQPAKAPAVSKHDKKPSGQIKQPVNEKPKPGKGEVVRFNEKIDEPKVIPLENYRNAKETHGSLVQVANNPGLGPLSQEQPGKIDQWSPISARQPVGTTIFKPGLLGGMKKEVTNQPEQGLGDRESELRKYLRNERLEITHQNCEYLFEFTKNEEHTPEGNKNELVVKEWDDFNQLGKLVQLLTKLGRIEQFKHIKQLAIYCEVEKQGEAALTEVIITALDSFQAIEKLDLSGCKLSRVGLQDIRGAIETNRAISIIVNNDDLSPNTEDITSVVSTTKSVQISLQEVATNNKISDTSFSGHKVKRKRNRKKKVKQTDLNEQNKVLQENVELNLPRQDKMASKQTDAAVDVENKIQLRSEEYKQKLEYRTVEAEQTDKMKALRSVMPKLARIGIVEHDPFLKILKRIGETYLCDINSCEKYNNERDIIMFVFIHLYTNDDFVFNKRSDKNKLELINVFSDLRQRIKNILIQDFFRTLSENDKVILGALFGGLNYRIAVAHLKVLTDGFDILNKNLVQKHINGYKEAKEQLKDRLGIFTKEFKINFLHELSLVYEAMKNEFPHVHNLFYPQQKELHQRENKPSSRMLKAKKKSKNKKFREITKNSIASFDEFSKELREFIADLDQKHAPISYEEIQKMYKRYAHLEELALDKVASGQNSFMKSGELVRNFIPSKLADLYVGIQNYKPEIDMYGFMKMGV